jgi:predicted dehydrogenase/predicted GH43/DUF377 family glycosyl hydrolase
MREIRFGIIGCGFMGREFAAAAARWLLLKDMDVRPVITAVCDANPPAMTWFEHHIPSVCFATTRHQELLARSDVEAVYCAIPHHLHEQAYIDIVDAGKHLLGEKPFGIDRAANRNILEAVAQHPELLVRCSSEMPFFPGAMRIIESVRAGRLGRIIEVEGGLLHSSDLNPEKPINWKRMIAYNGEYGCMGDLGMHALHVPLRFGWVPAEPRALLSKIVTERPDGRGGRAPCETWDNATIFGEVEADGYTFPMVLHTKRIAPGEGNSWFLKIHGTRRSMEFSTKYAKTLRTLNYETGGEQAWQHVDLGTHSAYPTHTDGIFEFGFSDAILQMWAAFCDELAHGRDGMRQPFYCVTPEETRLHHEILTAALQASGRRSLGSGVRLGGTSAGGGAGRGSAPQKTNRKQEAPRIVSLIAMLSMGAISACATQATSDTEIRVRALQERILAGPEHPLPGWAIGPFRQFAIDGEPASFHMDVKWDDPAGAEGWAAKAFWNPALLEQDGRLYLFYRTGPKLEGLDSRVALAWSDDGGLTWTDYEHNPIIYPTEPWEQRSVEDPRAYKYDGRYYLFYIAAQHRDSGGVYADIALAISDDLLNWKKHGRVLSREISKGWAKSPVIPRSPSGEAVKIDGEFLMYVSERPFVSRADVEEQMIGRSKDLVNWEFEQRPFLVPDSTNIATIFEVATLTTNFPNSDDMVGDVFYLTPSGEWSCGEVLYDKKNPTEALDFTPYGVCSWGGKIFYRGRWLYAQGWLERDAIQIYAAPPRERDRTSAR